LLLLQWLLWLLLLSSSVYEMFQSLSVASNNCTRRTRATHAVRDRGEEGGCIAEGKDESSSLPLASTPSNPSSGRPVVPSITCREEEKPSHPHLHPLPHPHPHTRPQHPTHTHPETHARSHPSTLLQEVEGLENSRTSEFLEG
jgi:hypothetical protein